MASREEAIAALEHRLGYAFTDRGLIDRALTHASIGDGARSTKGGKLRDNERLEFLGGPSAGIADRRNLGAARPRCAQKESWPCA